MTSEYDIDDDDEYMDDDDIDDDLDDNDESRITTEPSQDLRSVDPVPFHRA